MGKGNTKGKKTSYEFVSEEKSKLWEDQGPQTGPDSRLLNAAVLWKVLRGYVSTREAIRIMEDYLALEERDRLEEYAVVKKRAWYDADPIYKKPIE